MPSAGDATMSSRRTKRTASGTKSYEIAATQPGARRTASDTSDSATGEL
jgi:hypothetical protein